jgi:hypothetical protein
MLLCNVPAPLRDSGQMMMMWRWGVCGGGITHCTAHTRIREMAHAKPVPLALTNTTHRTTIVATGGHGWGVGGGKHLVVLKLILFTVHSQFALCQRLLCNRREESDREAEPRPGQVSTCRTHTGHTYLCTRAHLLQRWRVLLSHCHELLPSRISHLCCQHFRLEPRRSEERVKRPRQHRCPVPYSRVHLPQVIHSKRRNIQCDTTWYSQGNL